MKKILAMVLALTLTIGCLAGCGEQNPETKAPETKATESNVPKESDAPKATEATDDGSTEADDTGWLGTEDGQVITLRLWGGVQAEYGYSELCENFNEEYKDRGLQVEYTHYVNDTNGNLQLETNLMAGEGVDVFMGYGGRSKLNKRVEAGLVMEFSDALEERGFDLYKELGTANMSSFKFDDGSVYGFPTKYENNRWLMINVDMFNEAGVEIPYDGWTYSEFLSACEKLTKGEGQDKVYAISYTLKQDSAPIKAIIGSVLGENINYVDRECSAVSYDNEVYKEGFNMLMTTLNNGWAISMEDEVAENLSVANTYLKGKCAMTTCISQMRLVMDQAGYPHDFTTALVPGPVPDGAEYQTEYYRTHAAVTGAGDLMCIAAKTQYPEQAVEFALWYLQGGMAPLAKGGRIPLWTGMDKNKVIDVLTANAGGTMDLDSMRNYLSIDNTKGLINIVSTVNSQITTVFNEEWQAMCYGRQSVDDTIKNMTERSNKLLADAKNQ